MNKYYKIGVFYLDKYDIYGEDKVYMNCYHTEVIAQKVINGYKEIVTNKIIPERDIIDVGGPRLYDTFLGIYFTKKGITKEIEKKGYIIGTDLKYGMSREITNLEEIKEYLEFYDINKFPKMLRNIEIIKYQRRKEKKNIDNLVTEKNVKKLVKDYKYREEE